MSDTSVDDAPQAAEPESPLHVLWDRLARPFDPSEIVEALLGFSPKVTRQLIGSRVATSDEATVLLDSMSDIIRSLATSMETHVERCIGELRGPVMWSETMSARASTFGMDDLYMCSTPSRAYDIIENRVLVFALAAIKNAAADAEIISADEYDDEQLRSARRHGMHAARWLDHPSLSRVTRDRPTARELKRTRSGKKHRTYEPAMRMLELEFDPLSPDVVLPYCDQRTRAQHQVLAEVLRKLEERGMSIPPVRAEGGVLFSGPVQYLHTRLLGDRTRMSGILIGKLLIDVPERLRDRNRERAAEALRARAPNRETQLVMDRDDIDTALDRAIALARGS